MSGRDGQWPSRTFGRVVGIPDPHVPEHVRQLNFRLAEYVDRQGDGPEVSEARLALGGLTAVLPPHHGERRSRPRPPLGTAPLVALPHAGSGRHRLADSPWNQRQLLETSPARTGAE